MSITDSFSRSELEALVRALIEEARRRRRLYGGVLISIAVVGYRAAVRTLRLELRPAPD